MKQRNCNVTLKHSTQITTFLKHDLVRRIEDFHFSHRYMSRNKTIIDLLEAGLVALTEKKPDDEKTSEDDAEV